MGFYKSFRIANILTNLFSSKNLVKIVLFGVILLIIGMLFSNNVLAAEESVDVSTLPNLAISTNGEIISTSSSSNMGYFEIEPNYQYTITNNSTNQGKRFGFTDVVPYVGLTTNDYAVVEHGSTFTFSRLTRSYVYFDLSFYGSDVTITKEYIGGYDYVSQDIANTLSTDNLWNQLGFAVPLIAVAVLFAIGFILVRKLSKGTSKGKVKF